jgi:ABC-type glycerol-3-phosphate transport system substrate-binding protein
MLQKSKQPAYIAAIIITILVIVAVIILVTISLRSVAGYNISFEVWGPLDDSDAYAEINRSYSEIHPYIDRVDYKKMLVDEYKRDLLDALASGNGPDIFLIRNTWFPEFQDKILPAPENIFNEEMLRRDFVDVVADDVLMDSKVYGVPLSVDSLSLYYNKDIFNFEGVTNPPQTWEEFLSLSDRFTKTDMSGWISQSGASLGTAKNINRSSDILNALFLQFGTNIEFTTREKSSTRFQLGAPGREALDFYMQFSDINSPYYTWNIRQDYSIDAFQEGNLAMMLNYSWHYNTIKRKNNRLNFAVAPMPQFEGKKPLNYANYWVFVVAKNKKVSGEIDPVWAEQVRELETWQYLRYLTAHKGGSIVLTNLLSGKQKEFSFLLDPAKMYIEKTKAPSARRDLIEFQKEDPVLKPFVLGNLIARSWRHNDADNTETLFAEVIDSVHSGKITTNEAIRLLEERINTLSRR